MTEPLLRRLTQVALAATILAIASGSTSVRWVLERTRGEARWAALFALCALALAWAWRRGNRPRLRLPLLAGAVFAGLAVLSTAWSVAPRLTFERAGTIVVLFVAAGTLASLADRRDSFASILFGILAGVVTVALVSLLTLFFTYSNAVQPATLAYGARFQGYSNNPNTLGMLLALGVPIAVWAVAEAETPKGRAVAGGVALLIFGELVATGSRGSLLAALVGVLVLVAHDRRRVRSVRVAMAAACVVVFALGAAVSRIPQPTTQPPTPIPTRLPKDAELTLPLEAEIGAPPPGSAVRRRSVFGSSGRFRAWQGAIGQGNERPVAGYGFGTESRVFVDRYWGLVSDVTENSYIGLYLQLGVVGLLALATLLGLALVSGFRAAGRRRIAAAPLAVLCAGIVLGVGQSFVYSVGATGTVVFWICAFLATAVAPNAA